MFAICHWLILWISGLGLLAYAANLEYIIYPIDDLSPILARTLDERIKTYAGGSDNVYF